MPPKIVGITRYFAGKYLKFMKFTGLQKHAEDTNSVARSTSILSFISFTIFSVFKGSFVFPKKEFRDNSVAVLKEIAAVFIGIVTSAWVITTLDKTLRSPRPGKTLSTARKKKKKNGVKQSEFQLSMVIKRTLSRSLLSLFHFCAVTSPTSMTPNAVHTFVARGRCLIEAW